MYGLYQPTTIISRLRAGCAVCLMGSAVFVGAAASSAYADEATTHSETDKPPLVFMPIAAIGWGLTTVFTSVVSGAQTRTRCIGASARGGDCTRASDQRDASSRKIRGFASVT